MEKLERMEMNEISKKDAFSIAVNSPDLDSDDREVIHGIIKDSVRADVENGSYSPTILITDRQKQIFDKYNR